MARPANNHHTRKAEIVAAALKSFATYGFEGTTNKTIALEGGFKSPALIYHYFPGGKAELFQACLDEFQPLYAFSQLVETGAAAPPEVQLRRLALAYLELMEEETATRIIRIVITEMPRNPELAAIVPRHIFPVLIQPVLKYLTTLAASGRIELNQPLTAVLQFFGPLFLRVFIEQSGIAGYLPLVLPDHHEMVEAAVEAFLVNQKYQPGVNQ